MAGLGVVPCNDVDCMLTKGFIDRYSSLLAHLHLAIPKTAVFTIRVRFILLIWKKKEDLLLNLVPLLVAAGLFLPVLYLGLFFRLG